MSTREMTMVEALRDGLRVAMRSDPSVFLIGEDLGIPGGFGGGFTVTLGLSDEFGHARVMDTPISEIAIVGAAVGAAMTGLLRAATEPVKVWGTVWMVVLSPRPSPWGSEDCHGATSCWRVPVRRRRARRVGGPTCLRR